MRWRQTANKLLKWPNADTDLGPEDSALTDNGTRVTSTEPITISKDSTTALLVEYAGVKENVLVVDTSSGLVGIDTAPSYPLDIRPSGIASQIHLASSNVDSGGYITTASADNFFFSGGAAFNGTAWVAKDTEAGIIGTGSGKMNFYTDDSLTVGNTFTPTQRVIVEADGDMGIGTTTPGPRLDVYTADASTSTVTEIARIEHDSSGTPAAGFGARLAAYLESSTTARQLAGAIDWVWKTATHASRSAYALLNLTLNAATVAKMAYVGEVAINNNSATNLFDVTLASGSGAGGTVTFAAIGTNGTDYVVHTGHAQYAAVNKAGTITSQIVDEAATDDANAQSAVQTFADTWAITNGTGKITVKVTLNSNLTGTVTWKLHYTVHNGSGQAITIL